MRRLIIILLVLITFTGCKSYKEWMYDNEGYVCKELECCEYNTLPGKDSLMESDTSYVPMFIKYTDSSGYDMYFRCDSNNRVLLTRVDRLKDDKDSISYVMKKQRLRVKHFYQDSIKYYRRQIKELETRVDTVVVNKKVPVEVKEKYIPWWTWVILGATVVSSLFIGFFIGRGVSF